MPNITLDAEAFKVLASDTRLAILKALDPRPKTVSELGRELNLNKATVHEHLKHLLTGELIQKMDSEGRKWVYYKLSWKGKHLLHPENTTVLVLLSLAALGSAAAAVQLGNWLRWWGQSALNEAAQDDGGFKQAAPTADSARYDPGDGESSAASEPAPEGGAESGGTEPSDPASDPGTTPTSPPTEPTSAPSSPPPESGGEPEGAPPEGESSQLQQAAADGNQTLDDGAAESSESVDVSGAWDFLDDPGFWLFAVLALAATALAVAGMVIRARGRRM